MGTKPMIPALSVGPGYWAVLIFASILGANVGDVLSREMGLGYWRGLPVLAACFGLVIVAARIVPRVTTWYWLAIVIVRAAATNLSDWQVLMPGEPPSVRSDTVFPTVIAAWTLILACVASWDRRHTRTQAGTATGPWFWTPMLAAGTVGTAVGDWLAFRSGIGLVEAAALSTVVLAIALATSSAHADRSAIAFWILVLIVRTAGTNVGDLLSDTVGVVQGAICTAASTVAIIHRFGPDRLPRSNIGSDQRRGRHARDAYVAEGGPFSAGATVVSRRAERTPLKGS